MFNHAAEQGAEIWITRSAETEAGYGLIDGIQDGLSVLGLVPFAGDVVDGINALIYLARGQHAEAAMSAAAMVPFGGIVSTGLRLSKRVGKLFKAAKTAGSTADLAKGTTLARNLREQLAIEQAMSRPAAGQVLPIKMSDPRWPASDGWVKMQQMVKPGGEPINVHYLQNTVTGAVDDFKIVIPGARP